MLKARSMKLDVSPGEIVCSGHPLRGPGITSWRGWVASRECLRVSLKHASGQRGHARKIHIGLQLVPGSTR